MFKKLAILFGLLSLPVLAQTDGTILRLRDFTSPSSTTVPPTLKTTTAAVALFVDPTGSDSNTCTATGTGACLTIAGAVGKIPKSLRNTALVTAACGTYSAGSYIDDFRTSNDLNAPATGTYLQIVGTLSNSTLATGTATGTSTAGTAGTPPTFGTLTDGAQTWTVNDLRGRFVTISAGPGAGQRQVIQSNTATSLTIAGDWTSPGVGSTYAIQDSCAVITGSLSLPAQNNTIAAVASAGSFIIGDSPRSETGVTLQWFRFTSPTAVSARTSAQVRLTENQFLCSSVTCVSIANATVVPSRNAFTIPNSAGAAAYTFLGGPTASVTASEDFYRGASSTNGSVFQTSSPVNASFTNVGIENLAHGIRANFGAVAVSGSRFDTIPGDCLGTNGQGFTTPATANGSFVAISSNFATCGSAFNIAGGNGLTTSAITGATNTIIYNLSNGGVIQEASTSTPTGTTEISLDGVSFTVATLRAATPKSIGNATTFSRIWEP